MSLVDNMSFVRLFKALPIFKQEKRLPSEQLLGYTLRRGFIFSPEVIANYSEPALVTLTDLIAEEIGLTANQMNASLHKVWGEVQDFSRFSLFMEQLSHYIRAYNGYDFYGKYTSGYYYYISSEQLNIPQLEGNIKITVIQGLTTNELKSRLLTFLRTGIALKDTTAKDAVAVAKYVDLDETEVELIRNKEVKCILYDGIDKIPSAPIEFLRFAVYKSTKKTLLIKNLAMKKAIKKAQNTETMNYNTRYYKSNITNASPNFEIANLFKRYKKENFSYEPLATIFNRFKPLFLAFKANPELIPVINKISKLSKELHVPMKQDYLNNVTGMIANGNLDVSELNKALSKVNTFRKIRLAYALNFRTKNPSAIMYRIRNGKTYTSDFKFDEKVSAQLALGTVLDSITTTIRRNIIGKTIYIPNNITYALPSTEKQFVGNYPCGTTVDVPRNMVFGIHWENIDNKDVENTYNSRWGDNGRVDLDLSVSNLSVKIGWDSQYRSNDRGILFSGDIVNAPKPQGATELFYVKPQDEDVYIVNLNTFTGQKTIPYKFFVASEQIGNIYSNYMVNPNNVIAVLKSETSGDSRQKMLGIVITSPKGSKFIVAEGGMADKITSRYDKYADKSKRYLVDYYNNMISLNEMLKFAGAIIVDDPSKAEIDLSPENLTKDKIINLLK